MATKRYYIKNKRGLGLSFSAWSDRALKKTWVSMTDPFKAILSGVLIFESLQELNAFILSRGIEETEYGILNIHRVPRRGRNK